MKSVTHFLKNLLKKLTFIDYIIFGSILVTVLISTFFILRKTSTISVRVRITDRDMIYMYNNPPSWFVGLFQKGMKEKDFLGRTVAEVTDLYSYDAFLDVNPDSRLSRKTVYLTVKINAYYNRQNGQYTYKGLPVAVGESIRLSLGKILAYGIVTDMDGVANQYEIVHPIVRVQIKQDLISDPGTAGVDQAVADSVRVGDQIMDSTKRVFAQVTDKQVVPAAFATVDSLGRSHKETHPWKKDVFLTLTLTGKKIGDTMYYFDDFPIKVNGVIPLYFPSADVLATILEVKMN